MASSSRQEIEAEIRRAIVVQGEPELRRELRAVGREVIDFMKRESPVDPDDDNPTHYIDSFSMNLRSPRGRLPSLRIKNSDRIAHFVEDGTDEANRPQGGSSPAHHIFAKAAFRWGGTPDHGVADE
ncbi:hypothetical protein ACXDF8_11510 [Mycolicibacterium sp. CBM1]